MENSSNLTKWEDPILFLARLFRVSQAEVLATLKFCAVTSDSILSVINKNKGQLPPMIEER